MRRVWLVIAVINAAACGAWAAQGNVGLALTYGGLVLLNLALAGASR